MIDADDPDDMEDDRAPICPECGVTALPAEGRTAAGASEFVCENPDCESFGEPV